MATKGHLESRLLVCVFGTLNTWRLYVANKVVRYLELKCYLGRGESEANLWQLGGHREGAASNGVSLKTGLFLIDAFFTKCAGRSGNMWKLSHEYSSRHTTLPLCLLLLKISLWEPLAVPRVKTYSGRLQKAGSQLVCASFLAASADCMHTWESTSSFQNHLSTCEFGLLPCVNISTSAWWLPWWPAPYSGTLLSITQWHICPKWGPLCCADRCYGSTFIVSTVTSNSTSPIHSVHQIVSSLHWRALSIAQNANVSN